MKFIRVKELLLDRNFGQIYEVVNILYDMGNYKKMFSTESFYSLILNLSLKLGYGIFFRRIECYVLYVYNENFNI